MAELPYYHSVVSVSNVTEYKSIKVFGCSLGIEQNYCIHVEDWSSFITKYHIPF